MEDKKFDGIGIVHAMKGLDILVVGDIMLDRFVYGSVERISPESPVPVLSVSREKTMLGGAGNTLANLVNLQCKGRILSVVGADEDGDNIKELAQKQGIDVSGLVQSKSRRSIVKTRFLAGHQQLLRTDYERIEELSQELTGNLLSKAKDILPNVKIAILSDYGKGLLTTDFIKSFIELAKHHDVRVLVDPKGTDYSIYAGADIVTPNKKELSEATGGSSVETDEQVITAAQKLMEHSNISNIIATRSADGMSLIQGDGTITHIKSASDIEVFDVSGAGDSVIATIAASLAAGADMTRAARIANIAGSIVVSKVGTAPIRSEELVEAIRDNDGHNPRISRMREAPLLSPEEAAEEISRWKARGLKVGFTNGCFDVLHFGHVTYLNDARDKCDRLIIGLNSVSSVRILKGESRPVHDENSRGAVLSALGCVDMVVLFGAQDMADDNTACSLLAKLQPDIYFKGGDYTISQIPEAPTVQQNGGVVDIMPVYEGHSSTRSIGKIKTA